MTDSFPANVHAEKAILGAVLLDNAAWYEIAEKLNPEDFTLESHRRICLRMADLMKGNHAVDIVTLANELALYKEVEAIGGVAYLASLTEGMPRRPVIGEYIRIVKEKSELRYVLTILSAGMDSARERGAQPAEIKAGILSGLTRLGGNGTHGAALWAGEDMDTFLTATDAVIAWLVADVLAPGCMTQLYAPRGLGKSLCAEYWAVKLAGSGKRVLILDRDNPSHTLRTRLREFGADDLGDLKSNLKVISREKCPPLTQPEKWAGFPYSDYDVVIVDSLDAMAEGIGEQDGGKPARAMAPLLDICHRENGPAVLLLGNTIKSAEHSRGSGVIEDRADIVYELRDATDFRPTGGNKPWIEELPAQGASQWAARSSRRKGRTTYRLALVATKFRLGEEPAPRMLEISTADHPWTVKDVTAEIDAQGEEERRRVIGEKAARIFEGVAKLLDEIDSRAAAGKTILKTEAEIFLMRARLTKKDARTIIADSSFEAVPHGGRGQGIELRRHVTVEPAAKMAASPNPNGHKGFTQPDFRRPHVEHTAEIDRAETCINTGDSEPAISAADSVVPVGKKGNRQSLILVPGGLRV
jgi:hypothetical protein